MPSGGKLHFRKEKPKLSMSKHETIKPTGITENLLLYARVSLQVA